MNQINQNEIEIDFEDQKKINTFSTINRRKNHNLAKLKILGEELQHLKDCQEELEITMEDNVDFNFAECFIKIPTEEAQEQVETKIKEIQEQMKVLSEEKQQQTQKLIEMKQQLYEKFGKSIQLEE